MSETQAHVQNITIHLRMHVPSHEPRENDPLYHLFNKVHRELKEAGLLRCAVCGTEEDVQVHHRFAEFCFLNAMDWQKFAKDHPGIDSEEAFLRFAESKENMIPLCRKHHTGQLAIHFLGEPVWFANQYAKDGCEIPGEVILHGDIPHVSPIASEDKESK